MWTMQEHDDMPAQPGRPIGGSGGGSHSYSSEESHRLVVEQLRAELDDLPLHARAAKIADVRRALLNHPPRYAKNGKGETIRIMTPLEQLAVEVYGIHV